MKHYEVICAIIFNDEGKVFCCKRPAGKSLAGYWEFPGGKVEKDETHEQTIIREIKEELDSDIIVEKYVTSNTHKYTNMEPYPDFEITLHAYKCKLIKGNLDLKEHQEKAWKTKDEMLSMDFAPADIPLIKKL